MTEPAGELEVPQLLKLSQRRRLEFIEFRLMWHGRVNRGGLSAEFRISEQQASADISRYLEVAPGNMAYDGTLKAYIRQPDFEPRFIAKLTDRYLLQLQAIRTGRIPESETWFDGLPESKVAAIPKRPASWDVTMRVVDAIRERQEIEIEYGSLTSTSGAVKRVAPHALGHGAGRWHMRAWSREHDEFRDYTLERIVRVLSARPAQIDPACDRAWHETFELEIAPNPELSPAHQRALEAEHGMVDGLLRCALPISMCFYLENELQLDLPDKVEWGDGTGRSVRPARLQFILNNRAAYIEAQARARAATREALAAFRAGADAAPTA